MRRAPLSPPPAALALIALAVSLAASPAAAAGARIFRLPAEPLDRALLRFGVQGGVSVGGLPAAGCEGVSHPVLGVMTPAHALARLLPPTCVFRQLDPETFRVMGTPRPRSPRPSNTAGPAPSSSATALAELVVTAEKRPEPLIGSPYPISVLAAREIDRLGGASFGTIASQFAAVTTTNLGPGRDKILIRGLSDGSFTGRTQSTVGLYLDDVPITYNAPDPDLRLADIERVEVLRGPQGTLYGAGSISGVVHIVTRAPDPQAFAGSVTIGGAASENGAPSSETEAMLNVPLGHGVAVRGVAYADTAGGYLDNPSLGLTDTNKSRRWGGRLGVLAPVPGGWRLRATLVHQSIDTSDAQYTDGGSHSRIRNVQVREPSDNDFTEEALTLSRAEGWADLKISGAYVSHVIDSQYDATGAFPSAAPGSSPAAFDDRQQVALGVVEAVATSTASGPTRWLLGAFASEAREVDTGTLVTEPVYRAASVYQRRDRLQEGALYGEISYDITPRLTLTGGVRWFGAHRAARAGSFGLAASPLPTMNGELNDRGVAPKVRVSYAFSPDATVYLEAQKGYRAGGFNIPAAAEGGATAGPTLPQYAGDSLWNYEVGAVGPLFQRRLTLRVALFRAAWRGVQTDQFLPSGLPITVNIGDAINNGLEAEVVWRSGPHWQVRANTLLDDPQIVRLSGAFPARTDAGLPGVPNQMASADIRYLWTLWGGLEADVSAQATYVGRSHVTFDAGPSALMGGYAEGRLAAGVSDGRWRLRAYIDNVTGTAGDTFAFGNPFSRDRARQVTPLRPRTAGFDLTADF